jgi:RNA polymerase sigma-70 factor (ECF subfamily)
VADAALDFTRFYSDHFTSLCKQLYAYSGNHAEAQEVAQEAFSRAWERWPKVSRYDDPAAWVRVVGWRLFVSRWRRARTAMAFARRQREEHIPPPDADHVTLVAALAMLPGTQRRAVVLHYLGDLTVAQIATQEGVAEGTVKSWLHRARTSLAAHLDDTPALKGLSDDGRV